MNKRTQHTLSKLIIQLGDMINRQVNSILHHRQFQQLEASWRGLALLVQQGHSNKQLLIRVLTLSYIELEKDVIHSIEFDQSYLFKKVYAEEFDHPGGQPFGLLIGDYYFNHKKPSAIHVLREMSKIGAAAFCPFITGAHSSLFGVNHFTELHSALDLKAIFNQGEYQAWERLRKEEDSRFIGLVLPHILLREPYNAEGQYRYHRFFREQIEGVNNYLWGNAAYAYACVVMQSFIQTGWFADIRGLHPNKQSGGIFYSPIRLSFNTDNTCLAAKPIVNIMLTDYQEKVLTDCGFLVLRDQPISGKAIFYQASSLQKTLIYDKPEATQNAKLASMLHYLLCISRFAHYIKIMVRDKIGSFVSTEDCEYFIQQWLLNYCAANQSSSDWQKAKYPLNAAKVKLTASPGMPGQYYCAIYLKPHYQLDTMNSYLRLITQLNID